jgi:hypothetical protein
MESQQPITKRGRESIGSNVNANVPPQYVEDMVSSIHQALTTKQRLSVLRHLQVILETHQNATSNDTDTTTNPLTIQWFLQAGVVQALVLQLGYVLQRHGSTPQEVEQLCLTLDLFLRYSYPQTEQQPALDTLSDSDLGPNFFNLLAQALQLQLQYSPRGGTVVPITQTQTQTQSMRSALSILHTISGTSPGTLSILHCQTVLLRIVEVLHYYRDQLITVDAALLEVLGCLKNLTYYGDDYRRQLLQVPGLVSALTTLPLTRTTTTPITTTTATTTDTTVATDTGNEKSKALERLSAVWRNLAVSPETRTSLAQQPDILTTLVDLIALSPCNKNILRNVLNTFVSMAMDVDSGLLMIFHDDGRILECMKRLLVDEPDAVVRQRAARTLRLLTGESSAPILVHDTDLMDRLSRAALHDDWEKVRIEAAEAFAKCASLVRAPMPQHEAILEALTHLASSNHISLEVLARAFKEQASHVNNRTPMAGRDKLLQALARIALSDEASSAAKDDACCALKDLATEEANRPLLATFHILEALVVNIAVAGGQVNQNTGVVRQGTRREDAIKTMIYLATVPSNITKMVNHGNLLQSLISFAAATAAGSETKDQVKKVILMLVSEL